MNYEKYKSTISFPSSPMRPSVPKFVESKYPDDDSDLKAHKCDIDRYEVAIEQYIKDRKVYNQILESRRADEARLQNQFWQDAFEELGIDHDHPLAENIKSFVLESSNSNDYQEIMNHLRDLVILIVGPLQTKYCVFPLESYLTPSQRSLGQTWWEREGRASLTTFLSKNKAGTFHKDNKA